MAGIGATGCVTIAELEPAERILAEHVAGELCRLLAVDR